MLLVISTHSSVNNLFRAVSAPRRPCEKCGCPVICTYTALLVNVDTSRGIRRRGRSWAACEIEQRRATNLHCCTVVCRAACYTIRGFSLNYAAPPLSVYGTHALRAPRAYCHICLLHAIEPHARYYGSAVYSFNIYYIYFRRIVLETIKTQSSGPFYTVIYSISRRSNIFITKTVR